MQDSIIKLALDVGNKRIKFVVGELSSDGNKLRIVDYLDLESEGIRKSVIEDAERLTYLISKGINSIAKRTGIKFKKVSLGVSSARLVSKTGHALIDFEDEKEITCEDVEKLGELVRKDFLTDDEVVIEEEKYNVRIDSMGILKNPVGQVGRNLQGDVHLVTLDKRLLQPLIDVVNDAGLEIEDIWLKVSASAKATLKQEDRQMGVALVDIGEGITDVAIYKNNKIIYTKSIAIGGMHFVSDIAYLLGLSVKEAETILGKLQNKEIKNGKVRTEMGEYEVKSLYDIIEARTGDLIGFVHETIEESGFDGYLGKGIVFTGGGVWLDELLNRAGTKLRCAVRKMTPLELRGLENPSASYSTVIGVLLSKLEKEYIQKEREKRVKEIKNYENESATKNVDIDKKEMNNIEDIFTGRPDKKDGMMEKIKKWISNFI